jgi:hypothetical protein
MTRLTEADLKSFQQAIYKDYGILLPNDVLYNEAFNLLSFIEALIKFDQEDKQKEQGKQKTEPEVRNASMQHS